MLQMMMGKKSDLERCRADLAVATAKLDAIRGREGETLGTSESFAAWRRERDDAAGEADRLKALLDRLETAAAEEVLNAQRSELTRRTNEQRQANEALARRIREEGGPAIETLLALVRDTAAAAIIDARLNRDLPEDEKISSADFIARYRAPEPEKTVSTRNVSLWVYSFNGDVVAAQSDVEDLGNGVGKLSGGQHWTRCARRKFRQVEYVEAEAREFVRPFYTVMGPLPNADRPGMAWRPRDNVSPAEVLAIIEQRSVPKERTVLTKFEPVEPWQPPPDAAR